jgi:hypothetical protein
VFSKLGAKRQADANLTIEAKDIPMSLEESENKEQEIKKKETHAEIKEAEETHESISDTDSVKSGQAKQRTLGLCFTFYCF